MGTKKITSYYWGLKYRLGAYSTFIIGILFLILIFCFGFYIYMGVEGWNFVDSFYMIVITISTLGYGEVHPLSDKGMVLTSILIFFGIGCFFYLTAEFARFITNGTLQDAWVKRRMKKMINSLENHCIVCGYGRLGKVVVDVLTGTDFEVVVVERNKEKIKRLEENRILYLDGDASRDEILLDAGIKCAKYLVIALADETASVYLSLVAREMNKDLYIVAHASQADHIPRLKLAGANKVVLPYSLGGLRMAQNILVPNLVDFYDFTPEGDTSIRLEEHTILAGSKIIGKTVLELNFSKQYDLILFAIEKENIKTFNPAETETVSVGDILFLMGRTENQRKLMKDLK